MISVFRNGLSLFLIKCSSKNHAPVLTQQKGYFLKLVEKKNPMISSGFSQIGIELCGNNKYPPNLGWFTHGVCFFNTWSLLWVKWNHIPWDDELSGSSSPTALPCMQCSGLTTERKGWIGNFHWWSSPDAHYFSWSDTSRTVHGLTIVK